MCFRTIWGVLLLPQPSWHQVDCDDRYLVCEAIRFANFRDRVLMKFSRKSHVESHVESLVTRENSSFYEETKKTKSTGASPPFSDHSNIQSVLYFRATVKSVSPAPNVLLHLSDAFGTCDPGIPSRHLYTFSCQFYQRLSQIELLFAPPEKLNP
jgi:hypothetical protein